MKREFSVSITLLLYTASPGRSTSSPDFRYRLGLLLLSGSINLKSIEKLLGMVAPEDNIIEAVLSKFEALPARCKPQNRGNGIQEWVPLSGIVITRGTTNYQCSMRARS